MVKALGQSAFFLDRSAAFVVMAAAFIYVKVIFTTLISLLSLR